MKKCQGFNTAAQDSNPGSFSREYEALQVYLLNLLSLITHHDSSIQTSIIYLFHDLHVLCKNRLEYHV